MKFFHVIVGDAKVRGANLNTISKKFHRTKMSRPLQKIIPLEVLPKHTVEVQPLRDESAHVSRPSSPPPSIPTVDNSTQRRRDCAICETHRRATGQE